MANPEHQGELAHPRFEPPGTPLATPVYKGKPARLWWLSEQVMSERQRDSAQGTGQESIECPECTGPNPTGITSCRECGASLPQVLSTVIESSPVKVWTPRVVGTTSALLGWPGALVLLVLNRWRMKFKHEARKLALTGSAALLLYTLAVLLVPGEMPSIVASGLNFIVSYYLYKQADSDLRRLDATSRQVSTAHWLVGALLGLGGTLLWFLVTIAIAVLASVAGVPLPE